jgi:hypothetical protein
MAQSRAEEFGFELPTAEEMRHNRTVSDMIDEMTNGQSLHLVTSNPAEWNRLRAIAEEKLKGLSRLEEYRPNTPEVPNQGEVEGQTPPSGSGNGFSAAPRRARLNLQESS